VRSPSKWRRLALLGISLAALAGAAHAEVVLGPTYPIVEPDTMSEIHDKAAAFDWHQWMTRDPEKFAAFQSAPLPRATRNSTRLFDPTYALPQDIVGQDGRVLYPKGYLVNVYKTLHVPNRYIVIQGRDSDYRWLRDVAKPMPGDKVLLAGGNVLDERQRMHLELFMLDQRFIERFGLRSVPAIAQQEGEMLRVTEYFVRTEGETQP